MELRIVTVLCPMRDALEQPTRPSRLAIAAGIASACSLFLAAAAPPPNRYYMIDELVTSGDLSRVTSEIKVHGWVLPGTIEKATDGEARQSFVIHRNGKKLRIFHNGPLADTVRDQSELVATGSLIPAEDATELAAGLGVTLEDDLPYFLDVTSISAKCVTKYDGGEIKSLKFE